MSEIYLIHVAPSPKLLGTVTLPSQTPDLEIGSAVKLHRHRHAVFAGSLAGGSLD